MTSRIHRVATSVNLIPCHFRFCFTKGPKMGSCVDEEDFIVVRNLLIYSHCNGDPMNSYAKWSFISNAGVPLRTCLEFQNLCQENNEGWGNE